MSKTSIVMLSNTQGKLSVVGDKIRADGWYGHTDGLHTVAIYLFNFTGRIWFEASIADDPLEEDWFAIPINNQASQDFPKNPMAPTGTTGDTGTFGMNIIGSYTWLRVRMDRDASDSDTEARAIAGLLGNVDRVLLNN
jgi:hypothetical protein